MQQGRMQNKPKKEGCAGSMGQRSNYAAGKDVQTRSKMHQAWSLLHMKFQQNSANDSLLIR